MKTTDLAQALGRIDDELQQLPQLHQKPWRIGRTTAALVAAAVLLCSSVLAVFHFWGFDSEMHEDEHGSLRQSIVLTGEVPEDAPGTLEEIYQPQDIPGNRALHFVEQTDQYVTWCWTDNFYFQQTTAAYFQQNLPTFLPGSVADVTSGELNGKQVYFRYNEDGDGSVYWSDGRYCYCIVSNDVSLTALGPMIQSLEQIAPEECTRLTMEHSFIRPNSPLLEAYYVPTSIPEGLALGKDHSLDSISLTWQLLGADQLGVTFEQAQMDAITADTEAGWYDGRQYETLRQLQVGDRLVTVGRGDGHYGMLPTYLEYHWTEGQVSCALRMDPEYEAILEDPDTLAVQIIESLYPVSMEEVEPALQILTH